MKRIVMSVLVVLVFGVSVGVAQDSLGVRKIGFFDLRGSVVSMKLVEGFAYVTTESGIWIYDLSEPFGPIVTDSITSIGSINTIEFIDDRAYIIDADHHFSIVDIADHRQPRVIARDSLIYANSVYVSGDYIYLSGLQNVFILSYARDTLQTIGKINHQESHGVAYANVVKVDSIAYIACRYGGIEIFDLSNPARPEYLDYLSRPLTCMNIVLQDNFLYAACLFGGIQVYDLSNIAEPRLLDSWFAANFEAMCVIVDHQYIFLSYGTGSVRGIRVLDATNKRFIREVGHSNTDVFAKCVAVREAAIYSAESRSLAIYDWSEAMRVNPENHQAAPLAVELISAFPNPFNSQTTVGFTLPRPGVVSFGLFDQSGRQVRKLESSGWFLAGSHQIAFTADGLPSGSYLIQLQTGESILQQRVALVK